MQKIKATSLPFLASHPKKLILKQKAHDLTVAK